MHTHTPLHNADILIQLKHTCVQTKQPIKPLKHTYIFFDQKEDDPKRNLMSPFENTLGVHITPKQ